MTYVPRGDPLSREERFRWCTCGRHPEVPSSGHVWNCDNASDWLKRGVLFVLNRIYGINGA
jgi:hypothetical protein